MRVADIPDGTVVRIEGHRYTMSIHDWMDNSIVRMLRDDHGHEWTAYHQKWRVIEEGTFPLIGLTEDEHGFGPLPFNGWRGPRVCRTIQDRIATLSHLISGMYSMCATIQREARDHIVSVWEMGMAFRGLDVDGMSPANREMLEGLHRRLALNPFVREYIWDDLDEILNTFDDDRVDWIRSFLHPLTPEEIRDGGS